MIEIYKEPELEEMINNELISSEWKKQIEELGLLGQQKLVNKPDDSNPSIYMYMNESIERVFSVLCPMKENYKVYSKSTIPLEVLKEIALCVHENYFHKIEVWHDDTDPDPIVVGYTTSEYNSPKHLIARWGDEIIPLNELKIKAENRLIKSARQQYEDMGKILESSVKKHLNGQWADLIIHFKSGNIF